MNFQMSFKLLLFILFSQLAVVGCNFGNKEAPKVEAPLSISWLTQFGTVTKAGRKSMVVWDECNSIAVDASKNIYCAGFTDGNVAEANGGHNDAFVAKFNSTGTLAWRRQLGNVTKVTGQNNLGDDRCYSVAVDSSGNVYCAGFTTGSMGEASGGSADAFVMKLNSSGALVWLKQLGATTKAAGGSNAADDRCYSVAVDSSGNVYCAGLTYGSMGEASGGGADAFVVKFNSSGVLQWVKQLGAVTEINGPESNIKWDSCNALKLDSAGNIICGGETYGDMGEKNAGGADPFVWKLDPNGDTIFLVQLGQDTGVTNTKDDSCYGVGVDSSDNIYCGGFTYSDMGEPNSGSIDTFMMKLSGEKGGLEWVTHLGSKTSAPGGDNTGDDFCSSVTVDSSNNPYCGGYTNGALGGAKGGGWDAFVLKFNSSGGVEEAWQFGSELMFKDGYDNKGDEFCYGVAVDDSDNIYCAGFVSAEDPSAYWAQYDGFVMKFMPKPTPIFRTEIKDTLTTPSGLNTGSEQCAGLTSDEHGNIYCTGYTSGSFAETNGGGIDAFVMKMDSYGGIIWTTQFGALTRAPGGSNAGNDYCVKIALDSFGNIYCAGQTTGSMAEANGGQMDAVIIKLNPQGKLLWIKQFGNITKPPGGSTTGNDLFSGLAIDKDGNIICGGITNGAFAETQGGGNDVFVMKLNSQGQLLWVKQFGQTTKAPGGNNLGGDDLYALTVDINGNIYAGGMTTGSMGETRAGTSGDLYVMKLNSSGTLQWLKHFGTTTRGPAGGGNTGVDRCVSLVADPSGTSVYCGGTTQNNNMGETSGGSYDAIILKLRASDGATLWLKQLGTVTKVVSNNAYDECNGIAIDSTGSNVFCTGPTQSNMGETKAGAGSILDLFIFKLRTSDGALQWLRQFGNVTKAKYPNGTIGNNLSNDRCDTLTVDPSGNPICAGYTESSMGNANAGTRDVIVLKLKPDGSF
jgi:uncharacterized delta-60 repeat protein